MVAELTAESAVLNTALEETQNEAEAAFRLNSDKASDSKAAYEHQADMRCRPPHGSSPSTAICAYRRARLSCRALAQHVLKGESCEAQDTEEEQGTAGWHAEGGEQIGAH